MHTLKFVTSLTNLTGPVVVFDSGVGGLSIVKALQANLPELPLVYACDNAAFPYGEKEAGWLKKRLLSVIGQLIASVKPSLVVLACNTASTLALADLRATYNLPFVGVVPAIKPAASLTKTGVIGLLATCGTIKRQYTQELINKHAENCVVLRIGSNSLVELAESYLCEGKLCLASLDEVLLPLYKHPKLDTLILGCTHFPLLKPQMQQLAQQARVNWQWVDSSQAIANRVSSLISPANYAHKTVAASCWFTQSLASNSQLPNLLARLGFQELHILPNLPAPTSSKSAVAI